MSWIQTYTGGMFWPLAPAAEDVRIADIAHALSLQCRFLGHCRAFYSVAEHSCRMVPLAPPEDRLWALLHDAAEAYLADVSRPVKGELFVMRLDESLPFWEAEERVLAVIGGRYGLRLPVPDSVRRADLVLLATEARDLMTPPPAEWDLGGVEPLPERIEPWTPEHAEVAVVERECRAIATQLEGRTGAENRRGAL